MSAWRPVLEGDEATRAIAAAREIAARLGPPASPLLHDGSAGFALLFGELAREGEEVALDLARDALAHALEGAGEVAATGLWVGLAGIGFACASLADLVEIDDDTLAAFDHLVGGAPSGLDVIGGAIGVGVYARARGLEERATAQLERLADRTPDGVTWWSQGVDGETDPRGHHNLGMAHGVAGAIAYLGAAHELTADAVRWLIAQETARTPRYGVLVGAPTHAPRNGWCYGDYGTAMAFARAGEVERARVLARTTPAPSTDGGLSMCHGTAGRAHILARLAAATSDDELRTLSRRHYLKLLDAIPTAELEAPGLLDGWSSVAIALVAATSSREPSWDRLFLLS